MSRKRREKEHLETRAEADYPARIANGNSCKVYPPHIKTVIISRNVQFDELCQLELTPSRESGSVNLDPQSGSFSLPKENAVSDPSPERGISSCGLDLKNTDDENDHADFYPFTYYPNKSRSGIRAPQPDRFADKSAMISQNVL